MVRADETRVKKGFSCCRIKDDGKLPELFSRTIIRDDRKLPELFSRTIIRDNGKLPELFSRTIIRDDGELPKLFSYNTIKEDDGKLAKPRLRSWAKFGDPANKDDGDRLTKVSTEEIIIERPRVTGSKADGIKDAGGAVLMVCRTCRKKGDHWTSKCPYKDLAPPPEAPSTSSGATMETYVSPNKRQGADRSKQEMGRRNDENSVCVSNLSEDTLEPDLEDLFSKCGLVSCVYIPYDQKTGKSKGFGFVNFVHKSDAEKAIAKLNGYGYDNLILRVDWANTPRKN
ncbi:hypothetical protein AQUCO_00900588v1 [Aquilegia coerulea]|uniref:RRM domain-containing protein n=1 Tax=Aquilegia coerulea TaxID=218851 RepID=A0A2G5EEC0_AQUCA|nr:hypothetical protein AQUCO_00900588v1 [Aquilegia coerulea]